MRFENWALLDLRHRSQGFGPYDGERIVLHMVPKNGSRSEPLQNGEKAGLRVRPVLSPRPG